MKSILDITYGTFFSYRNKIYNDVKRKNLKNFVLLEYFYYDHVAGRLEYYTQMITKDSICTFKYYSSKAISVENLKEYNRTSNSYSYLFKKDSLYISRSGAMEEEEILRQNLRYFTHFNSKGKIDQLTINDSILYKKKGSKMVVDLSIEKWDIGTGEIYTRKNDTIELGTLKLANCIRDERSTPLRCDTLK